MKYIFAYLILLTFFFAERLVHIAPVIMFELPQPQLLHYPFLNEIPEADLALVDLQVLVIPGPAEKALIQQLSGALNKNIVLYNTLYQPKGGHLCRYLKFAALSDAELQTILEAEGKLAPHQAIVVYARPLLFA